MAADTRPAAPRTHSSSAISPAVGGGELPLPRMRGAVSWRPRPQLPLVSYPVGPTPPGCRTRGEQGALGHPRDLPEGLLASVGSLRSRQGPPKGVKVLFTFFWVSLLESGTGRYGVLVSSRRRPRRSAVYQVTSA